MQGVLVNGSELLVVDLLTSILVWALTADQDREEKNKARYVINPLSGS